MFSWATPGVSKVEAVEATFREDLIGSLMSAAHSLHSFLSLALLEAAEENDQGLTFWSQAAFWFLHLLALRSWATW